MDGFADELLNNVEFAFAMLDELEVLDQKYPLYVWDGAEPLLYPVYGYNTRFHLQIFHNKS